MPLRRVWQARPAVGSARLVTARLGGPRSAPPRRPAPSLPTSQAPSFPTLLRRRHHRRRSRRHRRRWRLLITSGVMPVLPLVMPHASSLIICRESRLPPPPSTFPRIGSDPRRAESRSTQIAPPRPGELGLLRRGFARAARAVRADLRRRLMNMSNCERQEGQMALWLKCRSGQDTGINARTA